MKILFALIISFSFYLQVVAQEMSDNTKNRIIIVHPTVYNLETVKLLISKGLLSVENIEILGVYHQKEKYDYSKSVEWIKNEQLKIFFLEKLEGDIEIKDIFIENVLTESFNRLFNNSKGIFFLGGDDMPALIYKEKTKIITDPNDPYRNFFETSFLYHLIGQTGKKQKPLISKNPEYICVTFCLGMQTMNVANGGTLFQDIPTEIYKKNYIEDILEMDKNNIHKNYNKWIDFGDSLSYGNLHKIKINKNFFGNDTAQVAFVYSSHHQCIKQLGDDYYITATSMDNKIIEAIRHKSFKNVYGVQFHPENKALFDENLKYKYTSNETSYFFGNKILSLSDNDFNTQFWKYLSFHFFKVSR